MSSEPEPQTTPEPLPEDIRDFLDAFEQLNQFESSHRLARGYGAFDPALLPIPAVIRVVAWLKKKTSV